MHLCIYASMHLCNYASMHPCIYLSICLSIYLFVECIKAAGSAAEDSSIYIYVTAQMLHDVGTETRRQRDSDTEMNTYQCRYIINFLLCFWYCNWIHHLITLLRILVHLVLGAASRKQISLKLATWTVLPGLSQKEAYWA